MTETTVAHKEAGILKALCRAAMAAREDTAREAVLITMNTVPADTVLRAAIMARVAMAAQADPATATETEVATETAITAAA